MKLTSYLESKIFYILFQVSTIMILSLLLGFSKIPLFYIALIDIISLVLLIVYLICDYYIQKKKCIQITNLVDRLDEKYYISEIIPKSSNIENKAYIYALKQATKSMNDKISKLEQENLDYREYIESFAHEIKTPISALSLSFDNSKDKTSKKELDKIDMYVDQILYYARCENPEKDYFVKRLILEDVVHDVLLKYRTYLLQKKIMIETNALDVTVYTDVKWLLFILSQIVQNSIKYLTRSKKVIRIFSTKETDGICLHIWDSGCGIPDCDIPRVFEKGFTGSNRMKSFSTGMGLYLSKKLCDRLGLDIRISSKEKEYTEVTIFFPVGTLHPNS